MIPNFNQVVYDVTFCIGMPHACGHGIVNMTQSSQIN